MKDEIKQWLENSHYSCYGDKLVGAIEQCFNDLGLSNEWASEPVAYMYQHEETGIVGFVDHQQIEWGFEKANPRLQIICPLYRLPPKESGE